MPANGQSWRIKWWPRWDTGQRVRYAVATGGAASWMLEAPRRRSLAGVSRDNGHRSRNRNAMIPDTVGMGQMVVLLAAVAVPAVQ